MSATVWSSPRLVYRAAETSDEAFLARLIQDPEGFTQAWSHAPRPSGDDWGKNMREYLEKELLGVLICLSLPDGQGKREPELDAEGREKAMTKPKPIGFVSLSSLEPRMQHHRSSEIGIQISSKFQGQGYGSEAIEWALRWGFNFAGLHRIAISAKSYNGRAVALYKKLGFVTEGVLRESVWFDGKFWDSVRLAMLEHEWREREAKKR